jgi:hypothetical protein
MRKFQALEKPKPEKLKIIPLSTRLKNNSQGVYLL